MSAAASRLVVVDLDQVGGVLRQRAGVGDDEGDRVADIMHLVAAQDRDVAGRRPGAVRLALHGCRSQVAEMRKVGAGQHQMHARRGLAASIETIVKRALANGERNT